jgi:photosystem II stability/assembly factor-like uncharacterized protein
MWLATSENDRETWEVTGPHHPMTDVYAVGFDARRQTPRLLAGINSEHYGPSVAYSDDLGRTWQEPDHAPIAFPEDTGAALARVWQFAPGVEPDVVYAGTEPSALFRSTDGGVTYELVRGLWDHPHREHWEPGGGGQAIHTVVPHPTDPAHLTVAMSTGGVYVTEDGGETWQPRNQGIKAVHVPDPYPEYGHCVHKIAQNPNQPDRFYAQVHHGVYRSDDGTATWQSIADGLPSDFGFPIAGDPADPDRAFVIPMVADRDRVTIDGRVRVWETRDAGGSWTERGEGLPGPNAYLTILRQAFDHEGEGDALGLYFGATSGEVFGSTDGGRSWVTVAGRLAPVTSVRVA